MLLTESRGGLNLEFGVFRGRTINHIAKLSDENIYGFDIFSGLPEDWRTGFEKGKFSTHLPEVENNVFLMQGLFQESIDEFVGNTDIKFISFMRIDCDLYQSTKTIFEKNRPFY